MNGLRTLGNNTPILNSWAGDGNYWYTHNPKVYNYYYVTFASAFGDDPVAAVNALAKRNAAAIAEGGKHRRIRHGPGGDRRASSLALKRERGEHERGRARRADGEVQERARRCPGS